VTAARTLSASDLSGLVSDLLAAGAVVVAPVRSQEKEQGRVAYARVNHPDQIDLTGPQPRRPLKDVILPPTEPLFRWRQKKSSVELEEILTTFPETVVVGARPCDAAALPILDSVMGWDYRDELWFGRRNATTIISLACTEADESCFCTAVGLTPTSREGADWFLTPTTGGFTVEVVTPKGEALATRHAARCPEATASAPGKTADVEAKVKANLDVLPQAIRTWLPAHFDDPLWKRVALRCHGCGACAFVCPTCHCFDIVDEPDGADSGTRRRNWDTCQTALFTLHGSGHNPRKDQAARFRQRLMHKFAIYPARFGKTLCTGCGRCVRACGAGMDLIAILAEINRATLEAGAER
jgi:ferredoxin